MCHLAYRTSKLAIYWVLSLFSDKDDDITAVGRIHGRTHSMTAGQLSGIGLLCNTEPRDHIDDDGTSRPDAGHP